MELDSIQKHLLEEIADLSEKDLFLCRFGLRLRLGLRFGSFFLFSGCSGLVEGLYYSEYNKRNDDKVDDHAEERAKAYRHACVDDFAGFV